MLWPQIPFYHQTSNHRLEAKQTQTKYTNQKAQISVTRAINSIIAERCNSSRLRINFLRNEKQNILLIGKMIHNSDWSFAFFLWWSNTCLLKSIQNVTHNNTSFLMIYWQRDERTLKTLIVQSWLNQERNNSPNQTAIVPSWNNSWS